MRSTSKDETGTTDALLGRAVEKLSVARLIGAAPQGAGGALLISGDAGMGKSALVAYARSQAESMGLRVLSTTGVHAERNLPFSGLHQLIRPIRAFIDRLPSGQSDLIYLALGIRAGAAPDPYAVALAALELFAESAQEMPCLILVDDAHWLDGPTLDVLAFVARRLDSEPVALIVASRQGREQSLLGLNVQSLTLEPLNPADAFALLRQHVGGLSALLQARLLQEAAGNPLALVELPSFWTQLGDRHFDRPFPFVPLTARLEAAFNARLAEMPSPTATLLLATAVDPHCSLEELLEVATQAGGAPVGLEDVEPALVAGILQSDEGSLTFRHPLIGSAVYRAATLAERIAVHAAMADVLRDDLDRSVWHRASSTLGLDENIARDLEEFSRRAQRRGAIPTAVAALECAATFVRGTRRATLLLNAGALASDLGRYKLARGILEKVEKEDLGTRETARFALVWEGTGTGSQIYTQPLHVLIDAALAARDAGDISLATSLLWTSALRSGWESSDLAERESIAAAADTLGLDESDVRLVAILAYATPLTRGLISLERLANIKLTRGDLDELRLGASAAFVLFHHPKARMTFAAAITEASKQGRLGLLARLLVLSGWSTVWTGNLDDVLAKANRAGEIAVETGDTIWIAGARALVAAVSGFRGDYRRCVEEVLLAQSDPVLHRAPFMISILQQIRAIGALAVGRYEEAWVQLLRVSTPGDPAFHHKVQYSLSSDLADAAVGAGRLDEGRQLLQRMEPQIAKAGWPWCLIGLRYARAVLATPDAAERLFADAMSYDLTEWPIDHGRLLLAYGSWLAKQGDGQNARAALQEATSLFTASGATAWAQKAAESYRRAGGPPSKTPHASVANLSAHELNIARLAASGLTNRQIAQRLFVSHRTIASHLYRVFPKLGVTTRAQLADALNALNAR